MADLQNTLKEKLFEANRCLYVLRSLRKEGYINQVEIGHLFQSSVLPKISYSLPVYAASVPELNTVQRSFADVTNAVLYPML